MTGKRTVVTEVSTRSPRDSWRRPRSINDVITVLERNGFIQSNTPLGVALVRTCGVLALRVTIAHGRATLETAQYMEGQSVRWRAYRDRLGPEAWQVGREALELMATLCVDTPVQWG